jgi:hypothetical protein
MPKGKNKDNNIERKTLRHIAIREKNKLSLNYKRKFQLNLNLTLKIQINPKGNRFLLVSQFNYCIVPLIDFFLVILKVLSRKMIVLNSILTISPTKQQFSNSKLLLPIKKTTKK